MAKKTTKKPSLKVKDLNAKTNAKGGGTRKWDTVTLKKGITSS